MNKDNLNADTFQTNVSTSNLNNNIYDKTYLQATESNIKLLKLYKLYYIILK